MGLKKGFVFNGLKLVDVTLVKREGKTDLIFVKTADANTFEVSSSLYFGNQDLTSLSSMKMKDVNITMRPSNQGFTADLIELAN